jgi:antibiotic biosynthesis monooxygenase (ABM) superfamily enzyme
VSSDDARGAPPHPARYARAVSDTKTVQLRRYEIIPGKLDEFVAWWQELLWPARVQHGFTLEFAFADHENSQFVWSVSLPVDEAEFRVRDAAWNDSRERAAALDGQPKRAEVHHTSIVRDVAV